MLELVYKYDKLPTGAYSKKIVRSREAERKYLIEDWVTIKIYEDPDDYDSVKIEMVKPDLLYSRNR